MKKHAIIVAGGIGVRMGSTQPKQFLEIAGDPIIIHTLRAFVDAFSDIQLTVVLPINYFQEGAVLITSRFNHTVHFVTGGDTRFHSVQNGLATVKEQSMVFVHDAVRCLVSTALIRSCYEHALVSGSAVPVLPSKDSIRLMEQGKHRVVDREKVLLVQTPQVFLSSLILPAFKIAYDPTFTDEATVVEKTGHVIGFVEGEDTNIKITRPIDLQIAADWLQEK
ncbi:MAG: 2-C-methyl-D-erythritol 4-phosphate cytidylyltransferase [Bacteroidetes bacterium]|nr:2-C-methyl-D-erythritol 4-phosphate cytidylyltransferase [Bacteroidota bacterium]